MAIVYVGHVAAYTGGLNAQVGWLGRRVGGRPARWPTFVRWTGWTLAVAIGHDDSTINIVLAIIIIIITITPSLVQIERRMLVWGDQVWCFSLCFFVCHADAGWSRFR